MCMLNALCLQLHKPHLTAVKLLLLLLVLKHAATDDLLINCHIGKEALISVHANIVEEIVCLVYTISVVCKQSSQF